MSELIPAEDIARVVEAVKALPSTLQQYSYLTELRAAKPGLFLAALQQRPSDLLPVVYTPGVGEACLHWGTLSPRPKALVLSPADRGLMAQKIRAWSPNDMQAVVVTDGVALRLTARRCVARRGDGAAEFADTMSSRNAHSATRRRRLPRIVTGEPTAWLWAPPARVQADDYQDECTCICSGRPGAGSAGRTGHAMRASQHLLGALACMQQKAAAHRLGRWLGRAPPPARSRACPLAGDTACMCVVVEGWRCGAGQRILGLGDLGANGAGISVGKALLYTIAGGVHPNAVLPVVLDVGCDDEAFRGSAAYAGRPEPRVTGAAYDELVEEFFSACQVRC